MTQPDFPRARVGVFSEDFYKVKAGRLVDEIKGMETPWSRNCLKRFMAFARMFESESDEI